MATITEVDNAKFTVRMVIHDCGECGVQFGMPEEYYNRRLNDRQTWYCPNGHPRTFTGPTKAERETSELRKQLEWARDDLARNRERLAQESKAHSATKGQLTKTKKRLAAGVCPYCHRNFVALGKHIRGQHPHESEHEPVQEAGE